MDQALPPDLLEELRAELGADAVLAGAEQLAAYSCDALTMYQQLPLAAVLPSTPAQLATALRLCHAREVPVVTRGAGTGLSGGALPHREGVLLVTARMRDIVRIDPLARTATVQPGVRNLAVSDAAARYGLFYGPDPSSQQACTIGGNVAENSGGVRCLKYGLTIHNVLALRCLTAAGEEFEVDLRGGGYDLLALLHGSEGMLAVVAEAVVALAPLPEARATMLCAFDSVRAGGDAIAAIIAAGIVPAGLEMMDGTAVAAVEEFLGLGYPRDAALVLVCETDGLHEDARAQLEHIQRVCERFGARDMRVAKDDAERDLLWRGRKSALPAVGRLATDYYCIDGTIPRRRLGEVLERIAALAEEFRLPCANVFHASDGNLHPLIMFHAGDADEAQRARDFGSRILAACLAAGGTVTGEHGVGVEKLNEMCLQFREEELAIFRGVRGAFDPDGVLNPGKAVPTLQRCAEFGAMHVHEGQLPHPELERF